MPPVFFACFIGAMIMAIYAALHNHATESPKFCLIAAVLALLTVSSLITYFRPRGVPAFITSTAYVGVILIGGIFEAGNIVRD